MNQFFVFYACLTCTAPLGLVEAKDLSKAECVSLAERHTADFAKTDGPYVVRCEIRGPHDMVWKLHPELKR